MAEQHSVFVGGRVFTGGQSSSLELGVSVRAGRIDAVGTTEEIRDLIGRGTQVNDLQGGLLLPGFQDAHMHPIVAGIEMLQCDLTDATSAEDALARIAAYSRQHHETEWILGGGWSMEHFDGGNPTRDLLDRVTGDRPCLLASRDHHSVWFNSAAARIADITRDTRDPYDGRLERDPDGAPEGTAHEGAIGLFSVLAPRPTIGLQRAALQAAQQKALSLGITGWQDALVGDGLGMPDSLDAYMAAFESDELTVRAALNFWWDRNADRSQLASLVQRRDRVQELGDRDRLSAPNVKVMVDGIFENFTAHLSEPHGHRHGHGHDIATPFLPERELIDIVRSVDAAGFGVHFHALGDAAITSSLTAVARARHANGITGNRHQIAHLQFVAAHDIPRFAQLDVIANVQALWAYRDEQFAQLTEPFLTAELLEQTYPFGQLSRAGARFAGGSDWPVSSLNPLEAAYVAANRTSFDGDAALTSPSQRLNLAEFLTAYTAGSAFACGRSESTGRLAEGFLADMVLLDQDPFTTDTPVHQCKAVATWVGGATAWRR